MSINDYRKILEVKRYSTSTIKSYTCVVQLAMDFFGGNIQHLKEKELQGFVYHFIHNKNASYAYQKQIVIALKGYYKEVWNREIHLEFLLSTNPLNHTV